MLTKPMANFSHIRKVGQLYFISGQGCRDPETNMYAGLTMSSENPTTISRYNIKEQTMGVFKNIERALATVNLTRNHIVDVTVFLKNMMDFEEMNGVWNEYFREVAKPPTRTTVAVADLPGNNFVELKAVASLDP